MSVLVSKGYMGWSPPPLKDLPLRTLAEELQGGTGGQSGSSPLPLPGPLLILSLCCSHTPFSQWPVSPSMPEGSALYPFLGR